MSRRRKKKYRDFIHGSSADTLIFNNDVDGNATEDPRDFHLAAGNRSSTVQEWGLFGQGGGYGTNPDDRVKLDATHATAKRASTGQALD